MKNNSYRVSYRIDKGFKTTVTVSALNADQAEVKAVKEITGAYGSDLCKTLEIIGVFRLPNIR